MSQQTRQALDGAMHLAIQRHQAGDLAAAEALYGKVLSMQPTHPGALHNLGLIRMSRGDLPGALVLLRAAVKQMPAEPTFQFNLGLAHQSAGDTKNAAAAYRKATGANRSYRKAWENLGVVLQDMEQHDEAIAAYRHALALDSTSVAARQNLGNALRASGRLPEAEAEYRTLLDQQPLHAAAAEQLAATRLSQGDYAGWDGYEWRYGSPESLAASAPWPLPLPKWDGSHLAGRHIHLYGEQGIGDEIMFASMVPEIASVATVTLWCEARLAPLFTRSFPGIRVQPKPAGGQVPLLGPADNDALRCPIASLPRFMRRAESDFNGRPYLVADAQATRRWQERFTALGGRLTVGLSWRGGGAPRAREARSVALARFAPLFAIDGIRVVDLQYGDHRDEIRTFNAGVLNPLVRFDELDPLRDMDGFAAAISALDAVVCVDNSTAHLAGALGVPTLLLLPFQADWRWVRGRETTAWYESAQLLWQREPGTGAWTDVVRRASRRIASLAPREAKPGARTSMDHGAHAPPPVPPASHASPDVLLLNDTSYWYHWGCSCTSLALHEQLRARNLAVDTVPITHLNALAPLPVDAAGFDDDALFEAFRAGNPALLERLAAVRTILVNGEGSLHDFGPTARALLYVMYIAATRLGKPVHVVNHSCYPATDGDPGMEALYRKVYGAAAYVAVREEQSLARLAALGINAAASFDCLPLFVARHPVDVPRDSGRVVMAGCARLDGPMLDLLVRLAEEVLAAGRELVFLAGANAWPAQDDGLLMAALQPRLKGRYRLVAATSEAEWLATLAGAGLLVSGRFHHSIAAACLGTPLLVAGSNTRKNEGLIDRLGLPRDAVWLDAAQPDASAARLASLLRDPSRGLVDAERLAQLRALAGRNFDHLPAP